MGGFSLIHWLVLGLIILLLFGGNRFSAMMGDVAKGLKGFKQGLADDPVIAPPAAELPNRASVVPTPATGTQAPNDTARARDNVQL
jgi:sec-independent protein translocase protein TatA